MKSVIIDRLIQIEESARDITKDVEGREVNLPVLIQKECEEIEGRLKSQYEKNAREIVDAKEKECEKKLEELEKDSKSRLNKLDQYFTENREDWENDIFNSIIGR